MIQIERMNTLFLFAVAQVWGLLLITLMPVSLVTILAYRDWKPKHDLQRAQEAAARLRLSAAPAMGHVEVDCIAEVKVLLRYCRTYKVELGTFDFKKEDELIYQALAVIKLQEGRQYHSVWEKTRSVLAPYFLKHV